MKILDDLTAVFGEEKGRHLLALAAYKLDGGGAMMNFEDWVAQVWLPDIEPRNGRRNSELLAKLTVTHYKKRYDRANERQAGAVTFSFDSTRLSTYSTSITDAARDPPNKSRNCVTQHTVVSTTIFREVIVIDFWEGNFGYGKLTMIIFNLKRL